jgi:hypothetical protein
MLATLLLDGCTFTAPEDRATEEDSDYATIQAPQPSCARSAISDEALYVRHVSPMIGITATGTKAAGQWFPAAVGNRLLVPLELAQGDEIASIVVDGFNTDGSLLQLFRNDGANGPSVPLGFALFSGVPTAHGTWTFTLPHDSGSQLEVVGPGQITSYWIDIEASRGGGAAFGPILVKTTSQSLTPGC